MRPSISKSIDSRLQQFLSRPDSSIFYNSLLGYLDGLRDANAITYEESSAVQSRIIATMQDAAEKLRIERADLKTLTTMQ